MNSANMKNTKDFDWYLDGGEAYRFMGRSWDVSQAKYIIVQKPRKIITHDLSSLGRFVTRPKEGQIIPGHNLDWNLIDNGDIDVDFPLIAVSLKETPWIIDGWHRIAKGFEQGKHLFGVAVLDESESKKVDIS